MLLTTTRLLLREFEHEDWQALHAYQSDPRFLRHAPWTDGSEDTARRIVGGFLAWRDQQPRCKFQFAIVLRAEERLVGNGGIRLRYHGAEDAEIGYELAANYWGHGYATEAARALICFGFEELGLQRVWAECDAENAASARVLERSGMQLRRRPGHWFRRGRHMLFYAVLRNEWQKPSGDEERERR